MAEVFQAGAPIDAAALRQFLAKGGNMAVVEDGGEGGAGEGLVCVRAAGSFQTGALSAAGAKIAIGCLLCLDCNVAAQAFRLTVRAVSGQVALSLAEALKQRLS